MGQCARPRSDLRHSRHTKQTAVSVKCVRNAVRRWAEVVAVNDARCQFGESSMHTDAEWQEYGLEITGTGAISTTTTQLMVRLDAPFGSVGGTENTWEGLRTRPSRGRVASTALFRAPKLTVRNLTTRMMRRQIAMTGQNSRASSGMMTGRRQVSRPHWPQDPSARSHGRASL